MMMRTLFHINTEEILANSTCIDRMVYVEGGTFRMGDDESERERPAHQVKVDSFYIGQFPVTQQLWEAVMGDNPSHFRGNRRPVERVSWEDTQQFFDNLNQLTGLRYRLPTEAEWEFAARGGNRSLGYEYAGSDLLDEVGWYEKNSDDESKEVGLKLPNELGLYDMSGNVWEWCQDFYSDKYYDECLENGIVTNPNNLIEDGCHVIRGGSWSFNFPGICRVSDRSLNASYNRQNNYGFRCARYV